MGSKLPPIPKYSDRKAVRKVGKAKPPKRCVYFAYGSNMNPARITSRLRTRDIKGVPAHLEGYTLKFNKRGTDKHGDHIGYANIVKSKKGIVEGIAWHVPTWAIGMMDVFEGYPMHYDRVNLTVRTSVGPMPAIVYMATPEVIDNDLLPTMQYVNHLLAGRKALSAGYIKMLEQQQAWVYEET